MNTVSFSQPMVLPARKPPSSLSHQPFPKPLPPPFPLSALLTNAFPSPGLCGSARSPLSCQWTCLQCNRRKQMAFYQVNKHWKGFN